MLKTIMALIALFALVSAPAQAQYQSGADVAKEAMVRAKAEKERKDAEVKRQEEKRKQEIENNRRLEEAKRRQTKT